MTRDEERLAENKLLLAIYGGDVFEGKIIHQERPFCCGREIDLLNAWLTFPKVRIGNRTFTLIEPWCPFCGKKVRAVFRTLN